MLINLSKLIHSEEGRSRSNDEIQEDKAVTPVRLKFESLPGVIQPAPVLSIMF